MAITVKTTKTRLAQLLFMTILCWGFAPYCQYDASCKYDKETQFDKWIFNQAAVPILVVLGVFAIRATVRASKLRITGDEQTGITVNDKLPIHIPWEGMKIDASILAKKGYLYVHYKDPEGQDARLTLDEFRLDYFDELYAMIRSKLGLPDESGRDSEETSEPPPPDSPTTT